LASLIYFFPDLFHIFYRMTDDAFTDGVFALA
jgi:hypothetical protein